MAAGSADCFFIAKAFSTMLRTTLAQLNLTIGDIEGNVQRMVAAARQAAADRSDLVVFSELALCGYYAGDMFDDAQFLQRIGDRVGTADDPRRARKYHLKFLAIHLEDFGQFVQHCNDWHIPVPDLEEATSCDRVEPHHRHIRTGKRRQPARDLILGMRRCVEGRRDAGERMRKIAALHCDEARLPPRMGGQPCGEGPAQMLRAADLGVVADDQDHTLSRQIRDHRGHMAVGAEDAPARPRLVPG